MHVLSGDSHFSNACHLWSNLTEVYAGSIVLSNMFTGDRKRAILEALAYSDIFEYPLRLEELHRYLPLPATKEEISESLAQLGEEIETKGGYYFLRGRDAIVDVRIARENHSRSLLPIAMKYGRLLGALPFIRMVALTGSLAVMNVSKNIDFDYMIVAVPGRVWTARALALLLNRITKKMGHVLCPNLIVAETALEWPLHDLYSARELYQMVPITGADVYQKLIDTNPWAGEFLPNARPKFRQEIEAYPFKSMLEFAMRGRMGDRFERWEMARKIARFSRQEGFGEETIFSADVCQGNFHHHRKWTRDALEAKVAALEKEMAVSLKVTVI